MIWSNDKGIYTCSDCGHTWNARERYVWWPIRFGLAPALLSARGSLFAHWGWQVGWDGIEQRVFGHTLRIGWVLIKFGRQRCEAAPKEKRE